MGRGGAAARAVRRLRADPASSTPLQHLRPGRGWRRSMAAGCGVARARACPKAAASEAMRGERWRAAAAAAPLPGCLGQPPPRLPTCLPYWLCSCWLWRPVQQHGGAITATASACTAVHVCYPTCLPLPAAARARLQAPGTRPPQRSGLNRGCCWPRGAAQGRAGLARGGGSCSSGVALGCGHGKRRRRANCPAPAAPDAIPPPVTAQRPAPCRSLPV